MAPSKSTTAGRPLQMAIGLIVSALMGLGVWSFARWLRPSTAAESTIKSEEPSFTVFLLGGSTAWGEPYTPRADFGLIVSWLLGGQVNGLPIRVVNLGGPGKPCVDVVEDAHEIARADFEPGTAVALLYLGNNEFLRFDEAHDLRRNQRTLLDLPTVVETVRKTILESYAGYIEEILDVLDVAGVPAIAATIAVNMKDWEPNRSVLRDMAHAPRVRQWIADGDSALQAGDAERALSAYLRILEIAPDFALASKRAGDCNRQLGRIDQARAHYQEAVDHDGNPYRETSEQNRSLREICDRHGVPVVDAAGLLEVGCADGLIGFDMMWDNAHPTLEGYARIAEGYVDELEEMFGLRRTRTTLDVPELERFLGFDDAFRSEVASSRGQYCYIASTLTWAPDMRLRRAELYLDQALALTPEEPGVICSLAILSALRGEAETSLSYWRRAFGLDPRATRQRAKHPLVGQIMERSGIESLPALLKSELR